jgi:5-methylcytosine-specific restriction endonuclease McrA
MMGMRMNRDEFTDGQKLAIWERSGHRCQGCSRPMRPWEPKQFDHIKPTARGGEATVENGQVLGECCWPAKNAEDQTITSKADMQAKKHVLGRKKSRAWSFRR